MSSENPQQYKRRIGDQIFKLFGMTLGNWVQVGIVILALMAAYTQFKILVQSTDYLLGFVENSDRYHSAMLGVAFKQGKPINDEFDYRSIRNAIQQPVVDPK